VLGVGVIAGVLGAALSAVPSGCFLASNGLGAGSGGGSSGMTTTSSAGGGMASSSNGSSSGGTDGGCDAAGGCGAGCSAPTGAGCGGPQCPPCGDGQGCKVDGDCASGQCMGGACATVFRANALGGFTSSNTIVSAPGQTIPFAPGRTLWLTYQSIAASSSTNNSEVILFSGRGSYGAGTGWALDRFQNEWYFVGLTGGLAQWGAQPVTSINALALVWKADTTLWASVNGSAFAMVGTVAASPVDGTSFSTMGSNVSPFTGFPFTSGRLFAFALWSSEATAAQAQALTFAGAGSRYVLPAAVTSGAVVGFDAGLNWNGSASTITTGGSAPVTFSVSGSPTLTNVDEVRVPTSSGDYYDGKLATPQVDSNGYAFTARDAYSRVQVQTDALDVGVEAYSSAASTDSYAAALGVYVNGSYAGAPSFAAQAAAPLLVDVQPGAGTGKMVSLWEGAEAYTTAVSGTRSGTFIQAIRLPLHLVDGVTAAHASILTPSRPQHRLVLLGDSILTGFFASVLPQTSITALLRGDFPSSGTGGVTCHCADLDSIANEAASPASLASLVASLAMELDGMSSNTLWIELGTSDYADVGEPAATFQNYYAALLTAVHTASPATKIYCQSPIQRIAPSMEAANGAGSTLGDYRKAISTAATSTGYCTYVEGAAGAIAPNADMYMDGVHLTDAGEAGYKSFLKTTLGY
jgi:lysophospholipase L1-like esterase